MICIPLGCDCQKLILVLPYTNRIKNKLLNKFRKGF
jgi:hypothetical protein